MLSDLLTLTRLPSADGETLKAGISLPDGGEYDEDRWIDCGVVVVDPGRELDAVHITFSEDFLAEVAAELPEALRASELLDAVRAVILMLPHAAAYPLAANTRVTVSIPGGATDLRVASGGDISSHIPSACCDGGTARSLTPSTGV